MPTDLRPDGTPSAPEIVTDAAADEMSDGSVADDMGRPPASAVRLARTAGLLYLAVAILGGFAQFVRVSVYAPGDAATTTANIVANQTLVRLSFAADLVQAMVWLVMAVVLYPLMSHAGRNLARAMVVLVSVARLTGRPPGAPIALTSVRTTPGSCSSAAQFFPRGTSWSVAG